MPYPDAGDRCPIEGCKRARGPGMLMCKPCWSRVPTEMQKEVYAAWRARMNAIDSNAYAVAMTRHENAKRAAIEAVERRGRA